MICEKLHYYTGYKKGVKGSSKKLEPIPEGYHYLGYLSTDEYIGHESASPYGILAVLKRELYNSNPRKQMPKLNTSGIGGYHGSEINSNNALKFTKKDLQILVEYMEYSDSLIIYASDMTFDNEYFKTLKDE